MVIGGDVKKWPCPNCGHDMRFCEKDTYDSKGNHLGSHAYICERCRWEMPVDLSKYGGRTEKYILCKGDEWMKQTVVDGMEIIFDESRSYRWVKEECCSEWAHMHRFYKKPYTYPTPSITNEGKPMNSCPFCGKPFAWKSVLCERVTVEGLEGEIVEDWEVVDK